MSITNGISRVALYYRRNGLRATFRQATTTLKRDLVQNRMVLFYCDLIPHDGQLIELPPSIKIEKLESFTAARGVDLEQIADFSNSRHAIEDIKGRFAQGAILWLIRPDGVLGGYGWTLQGRTVQPHYFRLAASDIHFFDFYVFPAHRGRKLNPQLVSGILRAVAANGEGRAFIEAAEWNVPQLSSLRNTPFRPLGYARKFSFGSRTLVCWDDDRSANFSLERMAESQASAPRTKS